MGLKTPGPAAQPQQLQQHMAKWAGHDLSSAKTIPTTYFKFPAAYSAQLKPTTPTTGNPVDTLSLGGNPTNSLDTTAKSSIDTVSLQGSKTATPYPAGGLPTGTTAKWTPANVQFSVPQQLAIAKAREAVLKSVGPSEAAKLFSAQTLASNPFPEKPVALSSIAPSAETSRASAATFREMAADALRRYSLHNAAAVTFPFMGTHKNALGGKATVPLTDLGAGPDKISAVQEGKYDLPFSMTNSPSLASPLGTTAMPPVKEAGSPSAASGVPASPANVEALLKPQGPLAQGTGSSLSKAKPAAAALQMSELIPHLSSQEPVPSLADLSSGTTAAKLPAVTIPTVTAPAANVGAAESKRNFQKMAEKKAAVRAEGAIRANPGLSLLPEADRGVVRQALSTASLYGDGGVSEQVAEAQYLFTEGCNNKTFGTYKDPNNPRSYYFCLGIGGLGAQFFCAWNACFRQDSIILFLGYCGTCNTCASARFHKFSVFHDGVGRGGNCHHLHTSTQ